MKETNKQIIQEFFNEIVINEETHTYTIGDRILDSVSGAIKRYTPYFDAQRIAQAIARKRGVSKQEILDEWKYKADTACERGNKAHYFGENFQEWNLKPETPLEEAIQLFWDNLPEHIVPVLNELKMYSKRFNLAGTADILLYNTKTKKYIIADYKTNADLFKNGKKGQTLLGPFTHLLDTPFNKYQLQLSFYQVLFQQIGYEVEDRIVIWLQDDGKYSCFHTKDYSETILQELIQNEN